MTKGDMYLQVDGVADELAVLLDDLADLLLVKVIHLVFLHVEGDLGPTANALAGVIAAHGEGATSRRFPDVLLVVIVLEDNTKILSVRWTVKGKHVCTGQGSK